MTDQQLTNTILRAEALMKSNWIHGLHLLEEAVREYPEDPRPYMSLAEFYIRRQLFDKAIKNLQTATKLAPQNDSIKYLLGNCYFASGEYRTAIVYYDMIKNPFTDVQYNKALALAHLGEVHQCIALTKELLHKVDNLPFLYFLLIEQLLRLSDYDEAQAIIRQAEQKIGKHGHLMFLKAIAYAQNHKWMQAYIAFSEADSIRPLKEANYLFSYAMSAVFIGLHDNAIELLSRAVDADPYNPVYYERLLHQQIRKGKYEEAAATMEKAEKHISRLTPVLILLKNRIMKGKT